MDDINDSQLPPVQSSAGPQLPPIPSQPETQINQPIDIPITPPLISEPIIQQDKKKNSIGFYIFSIIILLFLSSACYILAFRSKEITSLITKKNNNSVAKTSLQITNTSATSTGTIIKNLKNLSPKGTYLILKTEEDNLNTFDDYLSFMNKYSSKAKIAEINENLKEADSMPSGFKEQILSMVKKGSPLVKDITTVEETISGNKVTLNVSTNNPKLNGIVKFVLEDEVWKMESESWEEITS